MSTQVVAPPRRGRPRSAERLQRVLDSAACQFLEHGFERTSMESVALEAGVSKVTLYTYYPSKEALFAAVVSSLSDQVSGMMVTSDLDPKRPKEGLTRLGAQFLQLMRNDRVVAQQRVLFGLAGQQPTMCRTFYEQGPARVISGVAVYLQAAHAAGTLHAPDPGMAADQFLSMLLGGANFRVLLGMGAPTAKEDAAHLQACVETLLRAFAKPTKSGRPAGRSST